MPEKRHPCPCTTCYPCPCAIHIARVGALPNESDSIQLRPAEVARIGYGWAVGRMNAVRPRPTAHVSTQHFQAALDSSGKAPPATFAAVTAFEAEFDELLARLETHPKDRCVAYRWSQRVGFGTDYHALRDECAAKYPDGQFEVFYIDSTLRCGPEETVV